MAITIDKATDLGSPAATDDLLPFMRRPPEAAAGDDEPPRRPVLITFPPPPADRCRLLAAAALTAAERLDVEHVALLEVAAELLELDDAAFSARMRHLQGDEQGRALFTELLTGVQVAATDFDRANRALFVLRARLTAGLGIVGDANV